MSDKYEINLHWNFDETEIADIKDKLKIGSRIPTDGAMPIPDKGDLVTFESAPGVEFSVLMRRFHLGYSASRPVSVHIYLRREDRSAAQSLPSSFVVR